MAVRWRGGSSPPPVVWVRRPLRERQRGRRGVPAPGPSSRQPCSAYRLRARRLVAAKFLKGKAGGRPLTRTRRSVAVRPAVAWAKTAQGGVRRGALAPSQMGRGAAVEGGGGGSGGAYSGASPQSTRPEAAPRPRRRPGLQTRCGQAEPGAHSDQGRGAFNYRHIAPVNSPVCALLLLHGCRNLHAGCAMADNEAHDKRGKVGNAAANA